MPWSEWIQSDPYERGTSAIYRASTTTGGVDRTEPTLTDVYASARADLYADNPVTQVQARGVFGAISVVRSEGFTDDHGSPPWFGNIAQAQAVTWFTTDELELATWREWFPPELNDLTEGEDYAVRPDRVGTEDDAFIEYEGGAGTLTGWQCFIFGRVASMSGSTGSPHATLKWRLLEPAPTYPATPAYGTSEVAAAPLVLTPDAGSPMTEIVDGTAGQTTSVNFDIGPVTEFAVLTTTDDTSDELVATDGGDANQYIHSWSATGVPTSATALVLLPRWRYWKPGDSWVKLKNRGDGLGMSTKRLRGRGTSNQAGRLRGSY